ncbi:MarR family winged helix-turn-helix transcriptional regulator [Streptomyces sp. NPDC059837]|jgi:DNA-binding MarR family transcriptional regulator|uniref:MarR family winged helix-turn-helix transcriptional regulator n=1 Tax=unclassified Streptomyces TaxID=2593676 RepID=UPI00225A1A76|nr:MULTISPECIES: MarR family transcriptional regulator [unclassified Streptomyces]MCX4402632.1 MarR family transcriptional regulator [Streptomyces sp. NBC_01764]MCX5088374.1 MarR family transcriptional regulator [Streptomyces sp. NBC_00365]MCX5182395.1 MarR family transcriptional regulator [Streptomyces sp. NBC_00268]
MSIPTPPVNGQVIGLAHYASRAALETVLARVGSTFNQSVALRAVSDQGGTLERGRLVGRLTGALKIEESVAEETVEEMTALKLLTETDAELVSLTEHGREVFEEIRTGGNEIAARLYADIPAEDLATAGRVLTLLTERANAVLAGA